MFNLPQYSQCPQPQEHQELEEAYQLPVQSDTHLSKNPSTYSIIL